MAFLTLFFFIAQVYFIAANDSQMSSCSKYDSNCLMNFMQEKYLTFVYGDEYLGAPNLDPLVHGPYDFSKYNLNIKLTSEASLTGFSKTGFKNFIINPVKKFIFLSLYTPLVTLKSNYEAEGEVYGVPMNGQGPVTFKAYGLEITMIINYTEEDGPDGTYLNLTDYNYVYGARDVSPNYENVNVDDPEAAAKFKEVIKALGKKFLAEYGNQEFEIIMDDFFTSGKALMKSIVITDLIYDYYK